MLVLCGWVSIKKKINSRILLDFKNIYINKKTINVDQGKDEYYFWEVTKFERNSVVLLKLNKDRFKVCHRHILI